MRGLRCLRARNAYSPFILITVNSLTIESGGLWSAGLVRYDSAEPRR